MAFWCLRPQVIIVIIIVFDTIFCNSERMCVSWLLQDKVIHVIRQVQLFYVMEQVSCFILWIKIPHLSYNYCMISIHNCRNDKIACPMNKSSITRTNTVEFSHKSNERSNGCFGPFKYFECQNWLSLKWSIEVAMQEEINWESFFND